MPLTLIHKADLKQPKLQETRLQMVYSVTQYTIFTNTFYCSKCHTVSWYMCTCNFIYAHNRSTAFPVSV